MHAQSWLSLVSCPECGMPAEVTDLFSLSSTNGPVDHLAMACVAGHYFRMALDRLPTGVQEQLREARTCPAFTRSLPELSSGLGCSRLPGTLGTVGNPFALVATDDATAGNPVIRR
jgi:hypothetical protein